MTIQYQTIHGKGELHLDFPYCENGIAVMVYDASANHRKFNVVFGLHVDDLTVNNKRYKPQYPQRHGYGDNPLPPLRLEVMRWRAHGAVSLMTDNFADSLTNSASDKIKAWIDKNWALLAALYPEVKAHGLTMEARGKVKRLEERQERLKDALEAAAYAEKCAEAEATIGRRYGHSLLDVLYNVFQPGNIIINELRERFTRFDYTRYEVIVGDVPNQERYYVADNTWLAGMDEYCLDHPEFAPRWLYYRDGLEDEGLVNLLTSE